MNKNKDEWIVKHVDQRSSSFPTQQMVGFEEVFLVNPTSEKWLPVAGGQPPELMGVLLYLKGGQGWEGLDFDLKISTWYNLGAHIWCSFINVGHHPALTQAGIKFQGRIWSGFGMADVNNIPWIKTTLDAHPGLVFLGDKIQINRSFPTSRFMMFG